MGNSGSHAVDSCLVFGSELLRPLDSPAIEGKRSRFRFYPPPYEHCDSNQTAFFQDQITELEMSNQRTDAKSSTTTLECCMCGDYGLSNELFRCKICLFRFQHRYCSDLYPKVESYRVCNWCLKRKGRQIMDRAHNSFSLSSAVNNSDKREEVEEEEKSKNRRNDGIVGVKAQRGSLKLNLQSPTKKQRSPEQSSAARKRIIASGCLEDTLRRTKSEEIPKTGSGIIKQVFRGKVRRYKLLDEVSS
ncbi:hypothetical protein NE237_017604 [Protea cynaroides]|uniref:PHD-type zinc finger plants domain-containing protein n=1 Tax=Protea cynaroides TaxID=273540 RepID=A0A9Q0QN42_9MAGN|nr:hypothetical protein NE237_017604 [Protea cynaroides]